MMQHDDAILGVAGIDLHHRVRVPQGVLEGRDAVLRKTLSRASAMGADQVQRLAIVPEEVLQTLRRLRIDGPQGR
jgi:hypothetical protein